MRSGINSVHYQRDLMFEYSLVAEPDNKIIEMIMGERHFFHYQYHHIHDLETKAQITIAHFLARDIMEETLIRWIQNICQLHHGFEVTLNNFSGFPPQSIYLRIQEPAPLIRLANAMKMIDGFIQSNNCPPLQIISRPHLTIAGNLPEHVYNSAIGDYAAKTFNASFKVDQLLLLKRESGFGRYEILNRFSLAPSVAYN